jgi:hypothetical protein
MSRVHWRIGVRAGTVELRIEDTTTHVAIVTTLTPAETSAMAAALQRAATAALGGDPIGATKRGNPNDPSKH